MTFFKIQEFFFFPTYMNVCFPSSSFLMNNPVYMLYFRLGRDWHCSICTHINQQFALTTLSFFNIPKLYMILSYFNCHHHDKKKKIFQNKLKTIASPWIRKLRSFIGYQYMIHNNVFKKKNDP